MENSNERCHCGKDLHYVDLALQKQIQAIVDEFGPYIDISYGGRKYRVQRHYIALHGILGRDPGVLGFMELRTVG